jgi:hypothetical protein
LVKEVKHAQVLETKVQIVHMARPSCGHVLKPDPFSADLFFIPFKDIGKAAMVWVSDSYTLLKTRYAESERNKVELNEGGTRMHVLPPMIALRFKISCPTCC